MTNAEKVVRFLSLNDDKAFTPSEIAEGAGVERSSISTVLRRLEERDLVEHKGDYWAIGDEERVRDAFQFHRTMEHLDERLGHVLIVWHVLIACAVFRVSFIDV